ncbi:MAG: ABC transporter substrate-binding protein [bacterium]
MSNKKIISIVLILGLIGLLGVGISGGAKKPLVKVKIGYFPFSVDLPLFVAMGKGYFKSQGIEVEAIKFGTVNEMANATISGRIDGTAGYGLSTHFAIEENTPNLLKMYAVSVETQDKFSSMLLVRKDSPILSISDLRGKKIGTYLGATQLLNLKLVLQKFMDPEKDVQIIQVAEPLQIQALLANQFDALFTIEPTTLIALQTGEIKAIDENLRVKYVMNPFPTAAADLSTKFIKENPRIARKICKAIDKAIDFIRKNPTEAKKLLPTFTPLKEDISLKSRLYEWQKLNEINIEAIQNLADLFWQSKILKSQLDVSKMVLTPKDLK